MPVIIPEQWSQAVTSTGPGSITALRVLLVRSHTLEDFCWRWHPVKASSRLIKPFHEDFWDGPGKERWLGQKENTSLKVLLCLINCLGFNWRRETYRAMPAGDCFTAHLPPRRQQSRRCQPQRGWCPALGFPLRSLPPERLGARVFVYQLEADGFHLRISSLNLSSEPLSHILNSVDLSTWRLKSGLYKPNSSPPGKTACPV